MSNQVVFGLIGFGKIGRLHATSVMQRIQSATIKTVSDPFLNKEMISLAADLCIPNTTKNVDEIFQDSEISAVLICSSTDTHADLIEKAAKAGKDIFCEKPVDFDLSRVANVLDIVRQCGVKFQIGFNRRFDHNFKRIRQDVENGLIGKPHILKITSRDPAPPPMDYVRSSGGLFMDMMIHDFDMARYLMGSEATSIYAKGEVLINPEIGEAGDVDTAVVVITFENGALGVIDNSRQAVYGYDQRAEVFGSSGCSMSGNDSANTVETSTIDGVIREKPYHFFLERYFDAYVNEMIAFIQYLNNGGQSPCGFTDAKMPVVMGLAAMKSFHEKRPVNISEIT